MTTRTAEIILLALLFWSVDPSLAADTKSRIVHVVLVWLKDAGNSELRAQIIEATRRFSEIPEVEEIRVGVLVPSKLASGQ